MLEFKNLKKRYGDLCVYEDFSLSVAENETLAVLGDSGAGKTTLLNIAAGLLGYDGGEISGLPDKVSYVFQSDRLVPHLTVLENLKLVAGEREALSALERAGLKDFSAAYPARLSAGMSRRVAILRAFLYDAPLVLMDEPFRNLDLTLKYKLMDFYAQLKSERPKTALFVTHDIKEAVYLADRAVIVEKGRVALDIKIADKTAAEASLSNYFLQKKA
ncbi:MAG: ABC transporter [Bacillota bacterium]|nr:MAG: ABC transporter [Bacillota bacterium]